MAPPLLSTTWANLQRRHSLLLRKMGLSFCPSLSQHPLATPAHAASQAFLPFLLHGRNESRHLPAGGAHNRRGPCSCSSSLPTSCSALQRELCPVPAARLCWQESRECQRGQPSRGLLWSRQQTELPCQEHARGSP